MSLPHLCGIALQAIPLPPYLAADPKRVAPWRDRLRPLPGLRVGLAWAGNPAMAADRRRSITLDKLAVLAEVPGVSFVSLQKGAAAAQTSSPPAGMVVNDWTGELNDFADTAALIEALDLVITVDTAIVHLAGALGKPVWLLNRFNGCWRWLLDRDDSPWYPSLRQFRQPNPGDWDAALQQVKTALAQEVEGLVAMIRDGRDQNRLEAGDRVSAIAVAAVSRRVLERGSGMKQLQSLQFDPPSGLGARHLRAGIKTCLIAALLLAAAPESYSEQRSSPYRWSANLTIAPPERGKQRAETALATDNEGRVWLLYLDADYQLTKMAGWIASPRRLTAVTSTNEGRSFNDPRVLSEDGGDEAIAPAPSGGVYVSWIQYSDDSLLQKEVVQHINNAGALSPPLQCPIWTKGQRHDQSALYVSNDGTVHVLGVDIAPPPPIVGASNLGDLSSIYGRSSGNLETCSGEQRLGSIGELPAITGTVDTLLIVGVASYLTSTNNGQSFSPKRRNLFGGLVRAAVSSDRHTAYVVGDASRGGLGALWLQATEDGGNTWRKSRVDTAAAASAWRYPAIAVSQTGRVHVVWMDDRDGHGAVYHAYSDDGGRTFSENARVSDRPFYFPSDAPPPPPATQNGTWIGDYMSITVVHDKVVAAWSDQRAGTPLSAVYAAVGVSE